ncbi:MAG TPA: hypothetical protein VGR92_13185 [Steroidobacteraceae bacterium]|nr:hypothetical protein [Steroidobacteraceae bacterium]
MNVASRPSPTGKTRTCPHCKAVILESLSICPGCMHHLRFDSEAAKRQVAATSALKVEAMIRHPPVEEAWEYYVTISIRNDRGEEVDRQVVNVGALQGAEKRTFTLSVEVLPPHAPEEPAAPQLAKAEPTKAPAGRTAPAVPGGGVKPPPAAEPPKAPGRPAPPAGGTGIRLPDGTILAPPGLGPKRK